jgi:hypothetical protein
MAPVSDRAVEPRPLAAAPGRPHLRLALTRWAGVVTLVFVGAATGTCLWTVFLGLSLPPRYSAGHWNLLWTGFDAALVAVFAVSAWAAWFRRQLLASTALVAGTLLLCDAWFDIITSLGHRDQWLTLLTGLGGELPLALFFFWLYRRIVLRTLAVLAGLAGDAAPPRRLRDARIVSLPLRPDPGLGFQRGGQAGAVRSGFG